MKRIESLLIHLVYGKRGLHLYCELNISKRAPSEFRSLVAIEDETDSMTSLMNLLKEVNVT